MKKLMKILKLVLKIIIITVVACVLIFAGFLIYSTLTDYQPEPVSEIETEQAVSLPEIVQNEFSFLTWNIGYCGLGKEMDFFYEGGSHVRPDDEQFQKYVNGVYNVLTNYDTLDFFLLQEVDRNARRSYYVDQAKVLRKGLPVYNSAFAVNYKVGFVPLPVYNPMGKVESGLMILSRFTPTEAKRYSFPLNYSWPKNLFMLDRCFMVERFPLPCKKELVVINLHNSAFDDAEIMRRYELWMLRSIMLAEYEKGNYVVAGGDWNQRPSPDNKLIFKDGYLKNPYQKKIEDDFMPSTWHWCFDAQYPTNREVKSKYEHGRTLTGIIDYFVASPNLKILAVNALTNDFEFSDHHPVYLKVRLIENPVELSSPECRNLIMNLQDSVKALNDYLDKKLGRIKKPVQNKPVIKRK